MKHVASNVQAVFDYRFYYETEKASTFFHTFNEKYPESSLVLNKLQSLVLFGCTSTWDYIKNRDLYYEIRYLTLIQKRELIFVTKMAKTVSSILQFTPANNVFYIRHQHRCNRKRPNTIIFESILPKLYFWHVIVQSKTVRHLIEEVTLWQSFDTK